VAAKAIAEIVRKVGKPIVLEKLDSTKRRAGVLVEHPLRRGIDAVSRQTVCSDLL
jgi:hypothetical protein